LENGFARLAFLGGYFVAAPMGLTVLLRDSFFPLAAYSSPSHPLPPLRNIAADLELGV
jgi:hypothetical protein